MPCWCQREELNLRRADFQSAALPLSYFGVYITINLNWSGQGELNSRRLVGNEFTLPLSYARVFLSRAGTNDPDLGWIVPKFPERENGESGRTRTSEGVSREIYSLAPLPLGPHSHIWLRKRGLNPRLRLMGPSRKSTPLSRKLAEGAGFEPAMRVFTTHVRFRDGCLKPDSATLPYWRFREESNPGPSRFGGGRSVH